MFEDFTDLRRWYDYRSKRFWALVLILLYTLAGFLGVPRLLKSIGPDLVRENVYRDATIGDVRFNPWSLRLEVIDFALLDTDGATSIAEFDSLVLNLQLSSLFRFALDFREITLTGPRLFLVRYEFADTNIGRILNDMDAAAAAAPPSDEAEEDSGPLRLRVAELAIRDGVIDAHDEMPAETFETRIEPINIAVNDLSTLPDESGAQQISLTTENGVELVWTGSLTINPLDTEGNLTLTGSPLPILYRYFEDQLGFTLDNCCFRVSLDYAIEATPDGGIVADISNGEIIISDVRIAERDDNEPLLVLPRLQVTGAQLAWPAQTVRVEQVLLEKPEAYVRMDEDGRLNLDKLLRGELALQTEAPPPEPDDAENDASDPADENTEEPWSVELGEFRIAGMTFGFADRALARAGEVTLTPIDLSVRNISNAPEAPALVSLDARLASGGGIDFNGEAILLPELQVVGAFNLQDVQLAVAQPWAQEAAAVEIDRGALSLAARVASRPDETLNLEGDIVVADLSVSDTTKDEPLVGWQKLALNQTRLQLDGGELEISTVRIDRPFARVIIAADGTTNFQSLTENEGEDEGEGQASPETPPADTDEADPFDIRVGRTLVDNGSIDFSDLALPLPFRVTISEFGGTLSTLDTTSRSPSKLDFEGKVGEYGLTTLTGDVSLMAPTEQTEVMLDFRNLLMPDLTPYTAKFVGRAIESGKMNLDLDYTLADNRVVGQNKIVITDFRLGDKVESEDAMSLPLDLAIALLTDANGVIDLDLDVSGDLDDPDFSASGIILKAFANLITKAAAAPFKLLGSLVPGGENLDLDAIEFPPGRADLTPPEREKLTSISAAMLERPSLGLQLNGGFLPDVDTPALRALRVEAQVEALLGDDADEGADQLTRKIRKALEKLAKEQLPELSLRELQDAFERPDPETGRDEFDEVAYSVDLRSRLEAVQQVSDADLQLLATSRRDAMMAYLAELGQLSGNRYTAGEVAAAEASETGWVRIPLVVDVDEAALTAGATPAEGATP